MSDNSLDPFLAIVGMHCRVPGANGVDELWRNLRAGVESITHFSEEELLREGVDPALLADSDYVRARAVLDDIDKFDASFFGYTPREAELLDPQQRLFLECAWESLELAGCLGDRGRRIGVFAGCGPNGYLLHNLAPNPEVMRDLDHYKLAVSTERDFVATRVSYKLDLRGPSLSIGTACSTSLVAVHLAAQSLLLGECDIALAGGVSVPVPHREGYMFQAGGVLSPDGRCRAFDADSHGTAAGSGAAIVILRRYPEAVSAGNRIWAVLRGTSINNDGALKAGFTAPSVQGQAEAIADALSVAGTDAESIGYVETHGTGTELGDPIEIAALTRAYRSAGAKRNRYCAIGSIKTNLGHLDAAAGAIGLIKAALTLHHREIPPSLNFSRPNPEIDFDNSPFYVNAALAPWPGDAGPRRAGVSSFGLGGTNAHAILEEAPEPEPASPSQRPFQILPVSAKSAEAAQQASWRMVEFLREHPEVDPADAAFTLARGRRELEHRSAIVIGGGECETGPVTAAIEDRGVAFLFPGGGAQHTGMGRDLYATESVYREAIDRCATLLAIAPAELIEADAARMESPSFGLPALFATEYALARLWMSWGIRPRGLIGHSLGEYAAACIGGTLSLEDAVALVAMRGTLFERLPAGAMLAVRLSEDELRPLLGHDLSIAAVNGPAACVISGPVDAIESLQQRLADARRLRISVAAHSKLVNAILDPFRRFVETLKFREPMLPWVSNLTGTWITAEQAVDPNYWCRHLRETVRFSDGIQTLFADGTRFLLEAGPGQTLTTLALQHPARPPAQPVGSSLPHPEEIAVGRRRLGGVEMVSPPGAAALHDGSDASFLLATLGRLWSSGVRVDWNAFFAGKRRRFVPLPTYPFQRQSYWIGAPQTSAPREVPMPESSSSRRAEVVSALKSIVTSISGIPVDRLDERATFFSLGLDSLTLVQVSRAIKTRFGVKLSMRHLLEEFSTLEMLADHIAPRVVWASGLPPETPLPPPKADQRSTPHGGKKPLHFSSTPDTASRGLTPVQQRHLDALIERYTRRTRESKDYAQRYRSVLADSRGAVGFRLTTKELLYPIVGVRAEGSHLWDLDGNEYIDLTNAFGVTLFGHQPKFVTDALRDQLDNALILGPRSPLAGEAAELIVEMTGMSRVTFCNSGTEAIMAAIRLARTATGRSKIVVFDGSYHGHSDQTLLQGRIEDGRLRSEPMSPGIPPEVLENTIALEYGAEESLEYIRRHGDSIAAVLVEPVQSMRLDFQPVEFLRALREITRRSGTALIFDEMITGFRVHPGGAQAYFDVRADLVCYGKIIGGGLPIGIVAGSAEFMDGIDGGFWSFGDASFPAAERTFFGGTFCQHPMTMLAAVTVLKELKRRGPALQEGLNRRTREFVGGLNRMFDDEQLPIHIANFSSAFRFAFSANVELLFFHLIEKGVYTWEWRGCFLTNAHTDADLERVRTAIGETIDDLRAGQFLSRPSAPRVTGVPLTAAQRQLCALAESHESGALAYKLGLALRLEGALDVDRLAGAVRQVVARHDALRTVIDAGADCQRVLPRSDAALELIDFTGRAGEVTEWMKEKNRTPMDLAKGPLFLAHLLRVEDDVHILVLTAHHAILDGWSMTNLLGELMALYDGNAELEPAMQFREYVQWQSELLASGEAEEQETFWLQQLREPAPPVDALYDRPRPRARSYESRRETIRIDARPLRRFCSENDCTLFMFLYAAWAALLHRAGADSDLLIGVSSAGRSLEGSDALVGYCTHLLPVRNRVDANETFAEFLAATRARLLEAYANQDFPFAVLLNRLGLRRDVSRAPLVSLTFNLDRPVPMPRVRGLEIDLAPHPVGFSDFDLMVNVIDLDHELSIDCDFSTDVFSDDTVQRLLSCYRTLIGSAVAAPHERIARLPLLTSAEREELIASPSAHLQPARCLHELFETQAARTPDAVAVACEGESVTYAELNARANRLAHRLRARGVQAETLVGICAEPSIEMIASILAILKAGGAYVPLDPAYPAERLSMLIADSGVRLVVTQEKLESQLATATITEAEARDESELNPPSVTTPSNAAYVIYTSGSTGRPKGVVVQHDNVAHLFESTAERFAFGPSDVWTLFHSFAFDFSVWEIFGALLHGGRLVVVPYWITRNPDAFHRLVREEGVTVLNQTPSAFRWFMQADDAAGNPDSPLRLVIFGGEALSTSMLLPWLERRGDAQPELVNMYGITETTVHVTWKRIGIDDARRGSAGVGVPLPHLHVRILDAAMQPVPRGMTGEIYVGGAGVARGYLGREELTLQRFVPDPFLPGERLYRSGDLGRWIGDGEIEYRGRADQQIKIRGFRIEPAEVEAVVASHPSVRDVFVAETSGQLMAWLTAIGPVSTAELRAWAADRLAEHMVPASFIVMDALPLTRNGKVDRAALPLPNQTESDGEAYVTPRDEAEETLARIWSELLRVERVGIHDNFFELGGDSIIAMQVASRATAAGVPVKVRDVHRHPSIAELAALGSVPLTPAQRWFLDQHQPEPHHHNMSLLLDVASDIDAPSLQRALDAVVKHHEALRAAFDDGRQTIAADVPPVPLEEADGSMLDAVAARLQSSFRLDGPPLVRAALFRFGAKQPSKLLLAVHHLCIDGVSWRIVLDDLRAAYEQAETGLAIELPPCGASVREWTPSSNELEWDASGLLSLPAADSNLFGDEDHIVSIHDADDTRVLLQQVPRAYGARVDEILIAAAAHAMRRWLGDGPLAVDVEGHGRDGELDLARTVGWFTSIRPMRLGASSLASLVSEVRGWRERIARAPHVSPRAQILFNYLGQFDGSLSGGFIAGLSSESSGPSRSPRNSRSHAIEINAHVAGGRLHVDWGFNRRAHDREQVNAVVRDFGAAVESLAASCRSARGSEPLARSLSVISLATTE